MRAPGPRSPVAWRVHACCAAREHAALMNRYYNESCPRLSVSDVRGSLCEYMEHIHCRKGSGLAERPPLDCVVCVNTTLLGLGHLR